MNSWNCPVCGSNVGQDMFRTSARAAAEAESFRPSSEMFGYTLGRIVRCSKCGHGSIESAAPDGTIMDAYEEAIDAVSLREEAGQVETAMRALARIEEFAKPGRVADLGCWTGSFLVGAKQRGWDPVGIEPSRWGSDRARERGIDVRTTDLSDHGLESGAFALVVLCDVLEHLTDPGAALDLIHDLLQPGGVLYLTVPDAGSPLARVLGKRWWSVMPMHLQYFTRASMRRLLQRHGFTVTFLSHHAKAFSARYYAERLSGYSEPVGATAVKLVEQIRMADRMVAPDFHDRMQVIASVP